MKKSNSTERLINTVCMDHCTNACLLKAHVKDGKINRIETDDGGPGPQFKACVRGRAYRQLLYHPDRILYPLRRTGQRGEGKFERISWDEAWETVAAKLKRVRALYGAKSTILLSSAGDLGYLHHPGLIDRILVRLGGYTGVHGTVSDRGQEFASMATYGTIHYMGASSRDTLHKSRLVILWGFNPVVTKSYGGHMPEALTRLKESGIRIVSIDPRYNETAGFLNADWIPIKPGTDAAMLVAMAYVIIKENLQDQNFLDKYTIGFDKFKDYVLGKEDGQPKTPKWAEPITGVPSETIASLAREYASAKPAAIADGYSPGRTAYGEQFNRTIHVLTAMTGNIGVAGGGGGCGGLAGKDPVRPLYLLSGADVHMGGGGNPVDLAAPFRKDAIEYQWEKRKPTFGTPTPGHYYMGGPSDAFLNRVQVADAILKGKAGGYPSDYKLLYLITSNFVNQYGNTNKIVKALKELEFFVVHEQFMTSTAKFADIILPQNTILERNDFVTAPLTFTGFRNKVVDSLGESKSMLEIAKGLAAKLGIIDFSEKEEEKWLREGIEEMGIDYVKIRDQGIDRVPEGTSQTVVGFEEEIKDPEKYPFNTPSGKIEIYCQALADFENLKIPPIPQYVEAWESANDPLSKNYPLQLISPHYWRRTHSRFDNLPWVKELERQSVYMNGVDAKARSINDGDMVRVFNDRGQTKLPAAVTERMMPGVVQIPEGAWYDPDENGVDRGGCPNVLLNDVPSPGGALCTNTALVQVEKA